MSQCFKIKNFGVLKVPLVGTEEMDEQLRTLDVFPSENEPESSSQYPH